MNRHFSIVDRVIRFLVAVSWGFLLGMLSLLSISSPAQSEEVLSSIRSDVRSARSQGGNVSDNADDNDDDNDDCHHHHHRRSHSFYDDDDDVFGLEGFFSKLFFCALASPFWGPVASLDDHYNVEGYFARYPYDKVSGYMMREDHPPLRFEYGDPLNDPTPLSYDSEQGGDWRTEPWPTVTRRWSGRLRAEFGNSFDNVEQLGGHLLLESTSRFGFDTTMSYFEESFVDGSKDRLWIGDGNVTFRFAQGEHVQWRTGIGFNWLDDPHDTDFGFNFTYGFDCFPHKPWVLSTELDWGTLGSAELFRFRTTLGVTFRGLEGYIGYQYLDIDRTHRNSLIAGVRVWF